MNIVASKLVSKESLDWTGRATIAGSCEGDRTLSLFLYSTWRRGCWIV